MSSSGSASPSSAFRRSLSGLSPSTRLNGNDEVIVEGCAREVSDATFTETVTEDHDTDANTEMSLKNMSYGTHFQYTPTWTTPEMSGQDNFMTSEAPQHGASNDEQRNPHVHMHMDHTETGDVLMKVYVPDGPNKTLLAQVHSSNRLKQNLASAFKFVQKQSTPQGKHFVFLVTVVAILKPI